MPDISIREPGEDFNETVHASGSKGDKEMRLWGARDQVAARNKEEEMNPYNTGNSKELGNREWVSIWMRE